MRVRRNSFRGNTYSYTFVGISASHQIADFGSLIKETYLLVD
ncbi:hypothetical protein CNEO4_970007 [Clostridium neonatale]|uniref:Uncharacterized protein n=1 Tax=Clostridium neonatale TaxID=137838 RepID=A0AA86MHS7_9CLOT|nr:MULTISPECIES: hypothetical protein [Clostridium]CAG9707616.1 hypothetical protein CNEO_260107 [Clostridium neonatale]CAG9710335.1 hypothetical protein CNEO_44717 [Clostridium neonatale]CAG9718804.1 hypothetical protein CNEO_840014 [Clostridium neonatale]CAI3212323.1 hypothetical protein CNEO2_580009 [Clostridium neonatale]CAI3213115.1 hypothetical protein CNEO2_50027 [Clostridium neonatale]